MICRRINSDLTNFATDYKASIVEHYEKFLDLRKDADPGIVEVENARERLAGLKRQR